MRLLYALVTAAVLGAVPAAQRAGADDFDGAALYDKGVRSCAFVVGPHKDSHLWRAKLFAGDDDNRPIYIAKLKDIVAKYPDTAAANGAQKLLDQLE